MRFTLVCSACVFVPGSCGYGGLCMLMDLWSICGIHTEKGELCSANPVTLDFFGILW